MDLFSTLMPSENGKLKLNRPLVFFDLETTGTNVGSDRIVELSFLKLHIDGRHEQKSWRINPGIPIPPGPLKFMALQMRM
jgi:DNA polymerase III epsilon subunit-like protein